MRFFFDSTQNFPSFHDKGFWFLNYYVHSFMDVFPYFNCGLLSED